MTVGRTHFRRRQIAADRHAIGATKVAQIRYRQTKVVNLPFESIQHFSHLSDSIRLNDRTLYPIQEEDEGNDGEEPFFLFRKKERSKEKPLETKII